MVLMQISEPGLSSESAISKKLALGIDLGTTNSLIAFKNGKKVSLIGDETGDTLIPSVVYFPENGFSDSGIFASNSLYSSCFIKNDVSDEIAFSSFALHPCSSKRC